jgi:hypothetical protein
MAFTNYNLYCDESGTDGGPTFYFGAIYCSPTRARILEAALAKVREQHGLTREMKWTKVSQAMLLMYNASDVQGAVSADRSVVGFARAGHPQSHTAAVRRPEFSVG